MTGVQTCALPICKVEIWNPDAWYEEFTRELDLPEGEDDFGVSYDFGSVLER